MKKIKDKLLLFICYFLFLLIIIGAINLNVIIYKNYSFSNPDGGLCFWIPFVIFWGTFLLQWKKNDYSKLNFMNIFNLIIYLILFNFVKNKISHLLYIVFLLFLFYYLLYYILYFFKNNNRIFMIMKIFYVLNFSFLIFAYSFFIYANNNLIH